jgi:hypothetical protein
MTEKAKKIVQNRKAGLKKRFTNPVFIAATTAFTYKVLEHYKVAPPLELFNMGIDLAAYALIGSGIYSTFGRKK